MSQAQEDKLRKHLPLLLAVITAGCGALVVLRYELAFVPADTAALGFLAAAGLLMLLDVRLPRGEHMNLAVPLVAGALVNAPSMALVAALPIMAVAAGLCRKRSIVASIESGLVTSAIVTWPLIILFAGESLGLGAVMWSIVLAFVAITIDTALTEGAFYLRGGKQPLASLLAGRLMVQGPLDAAQIAVAGLLATLLASVGEGWALFLTVLLLLVIRQSLASLTQVRNSYDTIIKAVTAATEATGAVDSGHSDRVSDVAVAIGRSFGWYGERLERLRYAALLHEFGRAGEGRGDVGTALEKLASVDFLSPVMPVVSLVQGRAVENEPGNDQVLAAYIVASACERDAHRSGDSQRNALAFRLGSQSALVDRAVESIRHQPKRAS